jgi:hypothetical protein
MTTSDSINVTFVDKLFDLFASSAVTQGIITAIALGGSLWVQLMQNTVPEWLINIDYMVVAFFFGSKLGVAQGQRITLQQTNQAQVLQAMIDTANRMQSQLETLQETVNKTA